ANAFGACGNEADGDVVDEAEAHRLRVLRMMPGRPDDGENMVCPSTNHTVDSLHNGARGGARGQHRQGRDVSVGVEKTATGRCRAVQPRDVARIVDAMDGCLRRWRGWFRAEPEVGGLDRLEDGRHAFRTLEMALRSMPDLLRVGEQRNHERVRV